MKKMLAVLGLILALGSVSHAGTPRETFYSGQPNFSNTTIAGSTSTATGGASAGGINLSVVLAPPTVNGTTCRNCFTKFVVQLPTTTVFNVLDGGTTVQTIDGGIINGTTPSTFSLVEDHLGPLCLTAGTSTTLNTQNTLTGSTQRAVVNYEGYTSCGGTNNAGN